MVESQDREVNIVKGYRLVMFGRIATEGGIVVFPRPALGPSQPPIKLVQEGSGPVLKLTAHLHSVQRSRRNGTALLFPYMLSVNGRDNFLCFFPPSNQVFMRNYSAGLSQRIL